MIRPQLAKPSVAIALGAMLVTILAVVSGRAGAPELAARLSERAEIALETAGAGGTIEAIFRSPSGALSRHPQLRASEAVRFDEGLRDRAAKAVAGVAGVGGVRWADGDALVEAAETPVNPLHCEEDVEALLQARTIRFEEASARIDAASRGLIDEVARALRPCLGSIIGITGHTDISGAEPGNLALSYERAEAVREALLARGIPADGLRARGVGSREPVPGLEPTDPANRRIEFTVVATEPVAPTPIDTPSPR